MTYQNTYIIFCNHLFNTKSNNFIFGINADLANILIPTFITLLVFILGLFFQFYFQKSKRKSELKSLKTMLSVWIEKSDITIRRQIIEYRKFIFNLESLKNISNVSLVLDSFQLDKLDNIELERLSNLIILNHVGDEKNKTYTLFNITAQIKKILNIEKQIVEKYNSLSYNTEECRKKWNENYSELNYYISVLPIKKEKTTNKIEKNFMKRLKV